MYAFKEWRTAQDYEGKLYFYDENNESVWELPSLNRVQNGCHCLLLEGENEMWNPAYIGGHP